MAVILKTRKPELFISDIQIRIDKGLITDWIYDSDGDFTYKKEPWDLLAWFHPYKGEQDTLTFGIIGRNGYNITLEEYSKYHGLWTEVLIKNFAKDISDIEITMPLVNIYDSLNIDL